MIAEIFRMSSAHAGAREPGQRRGRRARGHAELAAYGLERRVLAVPHGHHEGVTEEDHELAGGDGVAVRLVRHRLEDREQ
jgi:hypothetical protein